MNHNYQKMMEQMFNSMSEKQVSTGCLFCNIVDLCQDKETSYKLCLSAICLADMDNTGVAFVAMPQIPPRNAAWMKGGWWVQWLKVAFERYFLRKVRTGSISPFYEKYALRLMGIRKRELPK